MLVAPYLRTSTLTNSFAFIQAPRRAEKRKRWNEIEILHAAFYPSSFSRPIRSYNRGGTAEYTRLKRQLTLRREKFYDRIFLRLNFSFTVKNSPCTVSASRNSNSSNQPDVTRLISKRDSSSRSSRLNEDRPWRMWELHAICLLLFSFLRRLPPVIK